MASVEKKKKKTSVARKTAAPRTNTEPQAAPGLPIAELPPIAVRPPIPQQVKNEPEQISDRSVAVIGGGIAGITAAVKLFRQGYHVTLFEKEKVLGGNFSSNALDNENERRDIYPHIMGDWYREFWHLLERDFGLERHRLFARRDKIKMAMITDKKAKSFADVDFAALGTPTSLKNILDDVRNGAASIRDMILFGYTYLDLVSTPRREQKFPVLEELDVTGYLYSRPFMNETVAEMHDAILKVIWSMPSEQTSAAAYQDLVRHTLTFPKETPFAWLAKGPIDKTIMNPITHKLHRAFARSGHSRLRLGTTVESIDVEDHVVSIGTDDGHTRRFRFAIVATPCNAALKLAFSGSPTTRLVDQAQSLAQLREGHTGRIPVVYLYFTKDFVRRQGASLGALPKELIGFRDASTAGKRREEAGSASMDYDISIIDIAKLWRPEYLEDFDGHEPVLVLAASRADLIPQPGPGDADYDNNGVYADGGERQGFAMIQKLANYLPFICPGTQWGQGGDIDWDRTHVITNENNQLFLNDAGSASWRPCARVKGLDDVFFAGDYCLTDVNMATIEAAAQSGVQAAQEVQKSGPHGHRIHLQPHDLYGNSVFLLVKLAAMPLASAVALTELWDDALRRPMDFVAFPFTVLMRGAAFGSDWVKTAIQLFESFLIRDELSPTGAPSYQSVADHDHRIGLPQWAWRLARDVVKEGPALRSAGLDLAGDAVDAVWERVTGNKPPPRASAKPWPITSQNETNIGPTYNEGSGTWVYDLMRAGAIPAWNLEGLSGAATGVSAMAKGLVDNLGKATAQAGGGVPNYTGALRAAVKAGADARRDKEMGYRVYETDRDL